MFVYLLHFARPISPHHTCRHYIGYTNDLAARLQCHQLGNGARLVQVANARGIPFQLVRVWRGGRGLERQLKNRKEAPALCPICNPGNRKAAANELTSEEIATALLPF